MNLYFLVEGRSAERKLYPMWLHHLLPTLSQIPVPAVASRNNYFLISGGGYPHLLDRQLSASYADVNDSGAYDYLVVCLDVDEVSRKERKDEVISAIAKQKLYLLGTCELVVILQNRCLETWLLANRSVYPRQKPDSEELQEYINYYNVFRDDPEKMGHYAGFSTHAQFHEAYLKIMLREKNIRYTKQNPKDAGEKHYLEAMIDRTEKEPRHLQTFQGFLVFCQRVQQRIASVQ